MYYQYHLRPRVSRTITGLFLYYLEKTNKINLKMRRSTLPFWYWQSFNVIVSIFRYRYIPYLCIQINVPCIPITFAPEKLFTFRKFIDTLLAITAYTTATQSYRRQWLLFFFLLTNAFNLFVCLLLDSIDLSVDFDLNVFGEVFTMEMLLIIPECFSFVLEKTPLKISF